MEILRVILTVFFIVHDHTIRDVCTDVDLKVVHLYGLLDAFDRSDLEVLAASVQ